MDRNFAKRRAKLKTIPGAEYLLNNSPECISYGIQMKYGKLVGRVENSHSKYYMLVEGDVYRLSSSSWDLNIRKGLTQYDPAVLAQQFPDNVTAEYHCIDRTEYMSFMMRMFKRSTIQKPRYRQIPYLEISYFGSKFDKSHAEAPYIYRTYPQPLLLSHTGDRQVNSLVAGNIRGDNVQDSFFEMTGVNVADIYRVATLMELPLCFCGCHHQVIKEVSYTNILVISCAHCDNDLFYGHYGFPTLDQRIESMIRKSQTRIRSYVDHRITSPKEVD